LPQSHAKPRLFCNIIVSTSSHRLSVRKPTIEYTNRLLLLQIRPSLKIIISGNESIGLGAKFITAHRRSSNLNALIIRKAPPQQLNRCTRAYIDCIIASGFSPRSCVYNIFFRYTDTRYCVPPYTHHRRRNEISFGCKKKKKVVIIPRGLGINTTFKYAHLQYFNVM